MENHLTSTNTPVRQPLPTDISVVVQETPFTNLQRKEINRLLKKGVFAVITKRDVLQDIYIFNSRFINKIKYSSTNKAFKKLRLIV